MVPGIYGSQIEVFCVVYFTTLSVCHALCADSRAKWKGSGRKRRELIDKLYRCLTRVFRTKAESACATKPAQFEKLKFLFRPS